MLPSALALVLTLGAPARADELQVDYALTLDGQQIGSRSLKLRFLGEDRLVQSFVELDANAVGLPYQLKERSSGRFAGSTSSAVATVAEGKVRYEVQARQDDRGDWRVIRADKAGQQGWNYTARELDLTTLSFFDPTTLLSLQPAPTLHLLAMEGGAVLTGAWVALEPGTLQVGGQPVAVRRGRFQSADGNVDLAWNAEGVVLDYRMVVMGRQLEGKAKAAPPPRSFGEFELVPFAPLSEAVEDQDL